MISINSRKPDDRKKKIYKPHGRKLNETMKEIEKIKDKSFDVFRSIERHRDMTELRTCILQKLEKHQHPEDELINQFKRWLQNASFPNIDVCRYTILPTRVNKNARKIS